MRPSALLFSSAFAILALAPVSGLAGGAKPQDGGAKPQDGASAPVELQFTKGDTRQGAQVRIRVAGDSVHYSRTTFEPGRDAVESYRSALLDGPRKTALKRIMGGLPQFRVFDSCFGRGMRYYLIDTPAGKFYRSLPESSGSCFADEPGIWTFFEDLDTFIAPPADDADDPDLSASSLASSNS